MSSGFGHFKNNVITTSVYHERAHQGLLFSADLLVFGIVDDGVIEFILESDSLPVHIIPQLQFTGTAQFQLFESPTFSSAGTPLVPVNRNRLSSYDTNVTVSHTPTLITDGTILDDLLVPGGSGGNASGGQGGFLVDWLLDPTKDYLLRAINKAGNAQDGHLHCDYYEDLD